MDNLPVIFGCAGAELSSSEKRFFADTRPAGFILFARNCIDPSQTGTLVRQLRETVEDEVRPIFIDQEGGRVQRLKPPHWRAAPPARVFGELARRDRDGAREAVRLNAALLASELRSLVIDVDCVPVLDVPVPGSHDIIGDRAFSDDPDIVADLGRIFTDTLNASGVTPVIKHIPGHGRAVADSHEELPVITASLRDLEERDFVPFRALADAPMAMVAHVLYRALDPERPASLSPLVLGETIRRDIGFNGVLISDDVSMGALSGSLGERARQVVDAGSDLVLHCNGDALEMQEVAAALPAMEDEARLRLAQALSRRGRPDAAWDDIAAGRRLDELLAG